MKIKRRWRDGEWGGRDMAEGRERNMKETCRENEGQIFRKR